MSSLFSFLRGRATPGSATPGVVEPGPEPPGPELRAAAPLAASAPPGGSIPAVDIVPRVEALLDLFRPLLPPDAQDMPPNGVALAEFQHRSLGVGGRRGLRALGPMDVAELRGGWLDGVVRFDLWGPNPTVVNEGAQQIQAGLLGAGLELRRRGLLRLRLAASKDEEFESPTRWRRTLDYSVLFEYRFEDSDGAASLIARIPVDDETDHGAPSHGHTEIRDAMVHWDDAGAPALELLAQPHAAPIRIRAVSIAAFLPGGGPAAQVVGTLVRAGVTETQTFPSLTAFLAQFTLVTDGALQLVFPPFPLQPGEVQVVREFQVGERRFDPPLVLSGAGDSFRIEFGLAAFPGGNQSQVYLQVHVR